LQAMSEGRSSAFAAAIARSTASGSCPSTLATAQPLAAKRAGMSSET